MDPVDGLIERCFAADASVRYVAVYLDGALRMRERAGLAGASTSESDRYEELLVNPALLTLATQRGQIDCGGLAYLLIRYGNFFTFIQPIARGHVNVGFELDAQLDTVIEAIRQAVATWAAAEKADRTPNHD
jgi:hypothetical protein